MSIHRLVLVRLVMQQVDLEYQRHVDSDVDLNQLILSVVQAHSHCNENVAAKKEERLVVECPITPFLETCEDSFVLSSDIVIQVFRRYLTEIFSMAPNIERAYD